MTDIWRTRRLALQLFMADMDQEDILMGITDWNEWMKTHHIKIYTEEELKKKKLKQTAHKSIDFLKRHKTEIIKGVLIHASET